MLASTYSQTTFVACILTLSKVLFFSVLFENFSCCQLSCLLFLFSSSHPEAEVTRLVDGDRGVLVFDGARNDFNHCFVLVIVRSLRAHQGLTRVLFRQEVHLASGVTCHHCRLRTRDDIDRQDLSWLAMTLLNLWRLEDNGTCAIHYLKIALGIACNHHSFDCKQ